MFWRVIGPLYRPISCPYFKLHLSFSRSYFDLMPTHSYCTFRSVSFSANLWLYAVFFFNPHLAQVNFFFLLNIVRVLITKLKKTHCAEATAYMKAVRAILILIPLLGVQYVILFWTPEGGVSNTVRIFLTHIFSHFQVPAAQDRVFRTDISFDLSVNLLH